MKITKNDILAKIEQMKTTCLTNCESCSSSSLTPPTQAVTISKTAYTNSFTNLTNAVNSYFASTKSLEQNLYDIIIMDFPRELTKNNVYNPPLASYPTSGLPTGENDYWLLYGGYSVLSSLLNYSNDYYFNQTGCIINPSITTVSSIEIDVTRITNAGSSDNNLQKTLINWLRVIPHKNALISLTENLEAVSINIPEKDIVGKKIYDDKHAKEIIESFGFDIYIPSYIER